MQDKQSQLWKMLQKQKIKVILHFILTKLKLVFLRGKY